jgi:hypothetical protein
MGIYHVFVKHTFSGGISMDDLTRRALAAYFRTGGDSANVSERYSGPVTLGDRTYVVLRDRRGGLLAVYRLKTTDMLRRLKRWPAAIKERRS